MNTLSISGHQLRAARALAGSTLREAARAANVGVSTLHRLEAAGSQPVAGNVATVCAVVGALESIGIRFERGGVVLQQQEGTGSS